MNWTGSWGGLDDSKAIVADAGPLIALAKLDRLELLSAFFNEILIPEAVVAECTVDASRIDAQRIQRAIEHGLLRILAVEESPVLLSISRFLDLGEAQALLHAAMQHLPVLMDERKGRREAARMGIEVIGTGTLIVAAKRRGLIEEVAPLLDELVERGYRLSPGLI